LSWNNRFIDRIIIFALSSTVNSPLTGTNYPYSTCFTPRRKLMTLAQLFTSKQRVAQITPCKRWCSWKTRSIPPIGRYSIAGCSTDIPLINIRLRLLHGQFTMPRELRRVAVGLYFHRSKSTLQWEAITSRSPNVDNSLA
jgi:hypothetical protein